MQTKTINVDQIELQYESLDKNMIKKYNLIDKIEVGFLNEDNLVKLTFYNKDNVKREVSFYHFYEVIESLINKKRYEKNMFSERLLIHFKDDKTILTLNHLYLNYYTEIELTEKEVDYLVTLMIEANQEVVKLLLRK